MEKPILKICDVMKFDVTLLGSVSKELRVVSMDVGKNESGNWDVVPKYSKMYLKYDVILHNCFVITSFCESIF